MATLLDKFNEGKREHKPEPMTDAEKLKKARTDNRRLRAENRQLRGELERAEKLMGSVRLNG